MGRGDPDPGVRERPRWRSASSAIARPAPVAAAAAQSLVGSFSSETDPRVRSMILYAVRDTRDQAVAGMLLQSLAQDSDATVRLAAADMLGDCGRGSSLAGGRRPRNAARTGNDPNFKGHDPRLDRERGRPGRDPILERIRGGSGDLPAGRSTTTSRTSDRGKTTRTSFSRSGREREIARGAYSPPVDDRAMR